MALVYRVVTSKAKVHVVDNRKELLEKDRKALKNPVYFHTKQLKTRAKHYNDAENAFLKTKGPLESHFRTYVREKMAEWGWS